MNKNDITIADIEKWRETIEESRKIAKNSIDLVEIKTKLADVVHNMCFMVAYIESNLRIEVSDEVYDRARELQNCLYHPLVGRVDKE